MADSFGGDMSSRAIYPSRYMPYMALLVCSKLMRSFGIFLSYDLLKILHVVQLLFLVKTGSSVFLILLQKPFSSGKRISKHQWFRIGRHAVFGSLINLLWLFGLTQCGPLRTLLLYEHSDLVVIAGMSALFSQNGGGPAKFRGAVFFLIAVMGLLLFDHDDYKAHSSEGEVHHHHSIITHLFNHLTSWTGLSDHKGGVVLLFFTLCLNTGYNSAAKKLSVDVGGAKRLHALSTLVSSILLLPWAAFIYHTRESKVESWSSVGFPIAIIIVTVFLMDYYAEAVCVNRMDAVRTARLGAMSAFVCALVLSCVWSHPYASQLRDSHNLRAVEAEDHVISGGVIFSFILFMFATHILTSANKAAKGSFIGYSAAGMPLYSFSGELLHRTSSSVLLILKNGLRQILEESDSRKIFYFLCVNLSFTFVELVYGVWTNSLGLISDGFHMLFDCSALVMGLYASVMTRWKATRIFSYGFDRVEVLSGFINGLFLVVISFFVFTEAVVRLWDPPEIKTERLLTVSIAGLGVNLFGILAFSHAHSHGVGGHGHSHGGGGGGHGHSHGGSSHGHSHGGSGHGHSHGGSGHGHSHSGGGSGGSCQGHGGNHGHSHGGGGGGGAAHNANMEGVFLHVLADTLGSVGVIVSTLLIETFGWNISDPICSIFIAFLIFMSVVPLLKQTCLILLLRTPSSIQTELGIALQKVVAMEGVVSYRNEHFWQHSSNVIGGMLHVLVMPHVSEQMIISQVTSIFKDIGVNNLTVQVEKESYFQHMSGLGSSMQHFVDLSSKRNIGVYENNSNFIKAI